MLRLTPSKFTLLCSLALLAARAVLALDPAKPPGGNFDLTHWKLTLPDATASEIKPPLLTTGYISTNLYTGADGAMTFWCPVTGGTTSGSSYPRSELRELIDPLNSSVNWSGYGTHVLKGQCKVLQLPSTGKVIIGQVHGYNVEPAIKLEWTSGKVEVYYKNAPTNGSDTKVLLQTLPLGSLVTYEIKIVDGLATTTVNGVSASYDLFKTNAGWKTQTYYFKAGVYVQDNVGPSDEGGRVAFYQLQASHGATNVITRPVITLQPRSQTVATGANVTLTANASGSAPLAFQWRTNGVRVNGATDTNCTFSNFRATQLNCDVVVTNSAGSVTSALARLYVNTPVRFISQSLDATGRFCATLIGAAGSNYVLYASTNLPVWSVLGTSSSPSGIIFYSDTNRIAGRRFLRAKPL